MHTTMLVLIASNFANLHALYSALIPQELGLTLLHTHTLSNHIIILFNAVLCVVRSMYALSRMNDDVPCVH